MKAYNCGEMTYYTTDIIEAFKNGNKTAAAQVIASARDPYSLMDDIRDECGEDETTALRIAMALIYELTERR